MALSVIGEYHDRFLADGLLVKNPLRYIRYFVGGAVRQFYVQRAPTRGAILLRFEEWGERVVIPWYMWSVVPLEALLFGWYELRRESHCENPDSMKAYQRFESAGMLLDRVTRFIEHNGVIVARPRSNRYDEMERRPWQNDPDGWKG